MERRSIATCIVALMSILLSTAEAQFVFKNDTDSKEYKQAVGRMLDDIFAQWARMNSDLPEEVLSDVANNAEAITIPHYVGVSNAPKKQTVTLKLSHDKFCDLKVLYKGVEIGEAVLTDRGKFETTVNKTPDLTKTVATAQEPTDSASIIKKFAKENNAFSVYGISMDNMLFYEKDGKYFRYNMDDLSIAPFSIEEAVNNKGSVTVNDDGKARPIAIVCSAVGGLTCLLVLALTLI